MNEKYYGELLLQKTVTLDYLTKYRVENRNHTEQYKVENNHPPIISKEIWDMAQKERERRNEIYCGENKDRSKYTKRYGFSGKLICGNCGMTYKRSHWTHKVVWQCINYIENDGTSGKRCGAKAVDDEVLKAAFVKVHNEEFKDKGNIIKAFLANVEKVIKDDKGSEIADQITTLEADLSGLIAMKLHKEIDEEAYSREYQRLNRELTDLKIRKDEYDKASLKRTKDIGRISAIQDIICDSSKLLAEFDEDLFDAMVEKVIIRSQTEFEFHFGSGQIIIVEA